MYITQIVLPIITLCIVVLTEVVIPKIKAKHPQEEINKSLYNPAPTYNEEEG